MFILFSSFRTRVDFSLFEILYVQKIVNYFNCLNVDFVPIKAQCLSEITFKLKPFFIRVPEFLNDEECYSYFFALFTRIFSRDLSEILKERLEKNLDVCLECTEKQITEYFELNHDYLSTHYIFDKYRNWTLEINLQKNWYQVAFPGQVFCFDSTMVCTGFCVTSLVDEASTRIVHYLKTQEFPSYLELNDWLNDYFDTEALRFLKFLHFDVSNDNKKIEFIVNLRDKGITASCTTKPNRNQLSESINGKLKIFIANHRPEGYSDEVEFEYLPDELKDFMIEVAIERYNSMKGSYSKALPSRKYSRDDLSEYLKYLIISSGVDPRDLPLIYASNLSDSKKLILLAKQCTASFYEVVKQYLRLQKISNIDCPLLSGDLALAIVKYTSSIKEENFLEQKEACENIQKRIRWAHSGINNLSQAYELSRVNSETNESYVKKLMDNAKKDLLKVKTQEERDAIVFYINSLAIQIKQFEIMRLQLQEIEQVSTKSDAISERIDQMHYEIKSLKELVSEKLKDEFSDGKWKIVPKGDKKKRLKQKKDLAMIIRSSIFPEDFPFIIKVCSKTKNDFLRSRYILSHVLLKITGLQPKFLRYINIEQLDNLFNKSPMFIYYVDSGKKIDSNKLGAKNKIFIPYVSAYDAYLEFALPSYLYIKNLYKMAFQDKVFFAVDRNSKDLSIRLLSEIWGGLSFKSFVNQMNVQLRTYGQDLDPPKFLTTASYRRGILLLTVLKLGISSAKNILNYKSYSFANSFEKESFLTAGVSSDLKLELLNKIHGIKSFVDDRGNNDKVSFLSFDDLVLTEEELCDFIDSTTTDCSIESDNDSIDEFD